MKHLIRDGFIWACCRFGLVALHQRQAKKPLVRVVAFHDVADLAWFESLIATLSDRYHILQPADFVSGNFNNEKINLLLTFDDGYDSWVTTVLPVLEQHHLRGIFFVSTQILEVANDEEEATTFARKQLLLSPKKLLTTAGLHTLHQSGQVIGAHTHSHVSLGKVSLAAAQTEVTKNKAVLEQQLGTKISHFAYPFGTRIDFSAATTTLVQEHNFTHIYSAISGFLSRADSEIPRTLVEKNQPIMSVCRWIEGGYDIFARITGWFKK